MPYKDPEKRKESSRKRSNNYAKRQRESNNLEWCAKNRTRIDKWKYSHPENMLLNRARQRAKKNGWKFNLELSDILIPQACPVLGIQLAVNVGGAHMAHNSPSLDRIDNTKGYVKGNVEVISMRANWLKNNSNLEELRKIVSHLEKHKEAHT